ncbi:putative siderophore transport system ATP-binding protein YusV [Zhongshania aliphaticivorans]|uniref:Putative siderophore transport system ATP-binding protein YusV n=1 Tax=Zhongshania aliphaticivorans TaxID=1470434 RepID=A0A5S9MUJ3_9GAMM|nr:ABC transporter ATP-binding protein [Zhongshania aliphaticivorans]CAA0080715.1 putative siderophore transport system ATP-binding protein YusV [Zhongshania aliphaticivorans]CAA0085559.1 putative siderophore transport system ATP-binding protein YusV [Zhongshania aliphaticivorans]
MIQLNKLSVGYPDVDDAVLKHLDMAVKPGNFVCLLGRNGAGKSTLLRTLAGLQNTKAGQVLIHDQNVHSLNPVERARHIAVVLTDRQFGLGLTVDDAVAMGRQPHTGWRGKLSHHDWDLVAKALKLADASNLAGRYLDDLSDGEKQRVMIARAVAQAPRVMLLDEITAFLDLPGRVASMMMLKQYAVANSATVVLSSHDLELSLQLADTIWLLDGKGNCLTGTPSSLQETGAIAAVFDTRDVKFSAITKQFELQKNLN